MILSQNSGFFRDLLKVDKPLPKLTFAVAVALSAILFYLSIEFEIGLYVIIGLAAISLLPLIIKYPKLWLYSVLVSVGFFMIIQGDKITAVEIALGLYYFGSLLIWFFWQWAIKKNKLVYNKADLVILSFYVLTFLNLPVALMNGVDIVGWLREYFLFLLLLFYFPFREYFSSEKDFNNFLNGFFIIIFVAAINQFYMYYFAVSSKEIKYAYQLSQAIRFNLNFFTMGAVFSLLIVFYTKSLWKKIIMIAIFSMSTMALITSFSRTFWLLLAAIVFFMFLFMPVRHKIYIALAGIFFSVVTFFALEVVFDKNVSIFYTIALKRIKSTSQGTKDISLRARLYEWDKVIKRIKDKPLLGNGFNSEFKFYNPITLYYQKQTFVHNGYLYLAYRLGIPLTLMFLFFYFYYLFKAERLVRRLKFGKHKLLALGALSIMVALVVSNMTAAHFTGRDGVWVVCFSVMIVSYLERSVKPEMLKNKSIFGKISSR